jgi:hypothetical protein
VYADLDFAGPQAPSAIAGSISRAARDSLISGQFDVALKALQPQDVQRSIQEFQSGHERLSLDSNLILLGAGAMLAYAPYRSTILLSSDPFVGMDQVERSLGVDAATARVRLHDALLTARKVITLNQSAFFALAPLLPTATERRSLPSTALRASGSAVLVVRNDDGHLTEDALDMIAETYRDQEFAMFDPATVFERGWKMVLQLGFPQSSLPGARLGDAWAGGVPVIQLVNPANLRTHRRQQFSQFSDIVVEHGKTGLLCLAVEELKSLLADLFVDLLPARAVARGARQRVDPVGEWDDLLRAILQ